MKTLREYLDDARETIDVNELIDLVDFADSWIESFHGVSFENIVISAAENDAENSYYGHFEWLKNNRAEAVGWMERVVKMGAVTAEGYDFYKHIEAAEFQQVKEHIEDFAADIYNYVVFKLAAEINPAPTAEQLQQLGDTCFNGYETVDEIRAAVTEILSK